MSSINVCSSSHFYIGSIEIQKNLYLENFFVHFELSTKRNHVNLCYFECIINPQYLLNRIILKIQGLVQAFINLIVSLNYNITLNRIIKDLYKSLPIWMHINLIVSFNYNITLNRIIKDLYKSLPIWMYH